MATNSNVNLEITNNADGFTIGGGTTKRSLSSSGANITLSGSVTTTVTLPGNASSTLVSTDAGQALSNKTLTSPTISSPFTLGATSVTTTGTQLNYLNQATGTTGTTSTNLVFSTSPSLTSPTLTGTSTIGAITLTGNITPSVTNTRSLGSSGSRFFDIYTNFLDVTDLVVDTNLIYTSSTSNLVGINTSVPLSDLHVNTSNTTATIRGILVTQYSSDTASAILQLRKSRGTGTTAVVNGDNIGSVEFQAYGTTNGTRARILATVSGTVSSDNVPTDLVFYTTATTEASLTERMRIASNGDVTIGGNLVVDTNVLYVDTVNNRVGINTGSPAYTLDVNGTLNVSGNTTFGNTVTISSLASTTNAFAITASSLTTASAFSVTSNSSDTSARNLVSIINDNAASTSTKALSIQQDSSANGLFIDHNLAGNSIEIDADANSATAMYGIVMAIDNAGAGLEYAFRFNGSEIVSAAVGGSQDKKIRASVAGTDYFIPLYTA